MKEVMTLIKDAAVTISTITVAIVAYRGLKTWQKELKGKTEYGLARRTLRGIYKVRNAVQLVRNPFMRSIEYPKDKKESSKQNSFDTSQYENISYAYEQRWKCVQEALRNLDDVLLEAEVLWGPQIIKAVDPLKECVSVLRLNLLKHLRIKKDKKHGQRFTQETFDKIDDIIYSYVDTLDVNTQKEDKFLYRLTEAIKQIETQLKPHLGR